MNAPITKVTSMIEDGLSAYTRQGQYIVASKEPQLYEERQEGIVPIQPYSIVWYQSDMMPSYKSEGFDTVQELANRMREIADLRTWRKVEQEY